MTVLDEPEPECCCTDAVCFFCAKHRLSGGAVNGTTCTLHWPQHIREKIEQRRRQIIVHSIIYYEFGDNILSDTMYDIFGRELIALQSEYPDISDTVLYHREAFREYTTTTGFDLPRNDPRDRATAQWLLENRDRVSS